MNAVWIALVIKISTASAILASQVPGEKLAHFSKARGLERRRAIIFRSGGVVRWGVDSILNDPVLLAAKVGAVGGGRDAGFPPQ
jgi:hypothetical protein